MDDGAEVYRVAEDIVRCMGGGAYSYLCEQADIAQLAGDRESAITWWDVAAAAIQILNAGGPYPALPDSTPQAGKKWALSGITAAQVVRVGSRRGRFPRSTVAQPHR